MGLHVSWPKIKKKNAEGWLTSEERFKKSRVLSHISGKWSELSVGYKDQDNDADPPTHLICERKRDHLAVKGKWMIWMKSTSRSIQEGFFL